MLSLVQGSSAL